MGLKRLKAAASAPDLINPIVPDVDHRGLKGQGDDALFNLRKGNKGIQHEDPRTNKTTSNGWTLK